MCGALLAGMVAEFELRYAFIMAALMALCAAVLCLSMKFERGAAREDDLADIGLASPVNPADP